MSGWVWVWVVRIGRLGRWRYRSEGGVVVSILNGRRVVLRLSGRHGWMMGRLDVSARLSGGFAVWGGTWCVVSMRRWCGGGSGELGALGDGRAYVAGRQ